MLERAENLSRVELHVVLDSDLIGSDPTEQVTPLDEVHLNVDTLRILKRRVGPHNEMALILRLTQVHDYFLFTHYVLSVLS